MTAPYDLNLAKFIVLIWKHGSRNPKVFPCKTIEEFRATMATECEHKRTSYAIGYELSEAFHPVITPMTASEARKHYRVGDGA